jgi:hypothetical protein
MRKEILIGSALLIVAFGSGCDRARAENRTANARLGPAGNCPIGAGPMQPTIAGASADRNRDGYICRRQAVSIAGDSQLLYVDNDASVASRPGDADPVWRALYTGM